VLGTGSAHCKNQLVETIQIFGLFYLVIQTTCKNNQGYLKLVILTRCYGHFNILSWLFKLQMVKLTTMHDFVFFCFFFVNKPVVLHQLISQLSEISLSATFFQLRHRQY